MKNIHDLYNQLGATLSAILAHKDCPAIVYNAICALTDNSKTPAIEREVPAARGTLRSILTLTDRTPVPERQQTTARS